jgi:predicted pyridoxal phosphate-dependent enzyme apparently involved in regulation of cell wall biogenesis
MHLQPVFQHLDAYVNGNSERLFTNGVSLPSGSALDDAAMERVADRLRAVIGRSR